MVAVDEGTPIGIAFAHAREDEWFLSELYVEPSFRQQGIGLGLLEEAARGAGDVVRSGYLGASDPEALAFFVRRGVALRAPVLELSGEVPHDNELVRIAAGEYRFHAVPLDLNAHRHALVQLDRETIGCDRLLDHAYFAEHASGTVFVRESEIVAYAYGWPSGTIGPMAAASPAYAVQVFGFALAALRQQYGATWCRVMVPGSNIRLARAATRAGLRIEGAGVFASDATAHDLSRYAAFDPLLF